MASSRRMRCVMGLDVSHPDHAGSVRFRLAALDPHRLHHDVLERPVRRTCRHASDALHEADVVALAEDGVAIVEVRGQDLRHEELAAVRVRARVRHREQRAAVVAQRRVELVGEAIAGPPLPVPVGSPPWIMKRGITRWKINPS